MRDFPIEHQVGFEDFEGGVDEAGRPDTKAAYCRALYEEYRQSDYRERKLEEIAEGRARFAGDRPEKSFPFPGCSNKSLMLDRIAVEGLEPRVMAQIVAEDDYVAVRPVGPEDERHVKYLRDFVAWMLRSGVKARRTMKPIVHDLLLDGTIDVIPVWEEENVTRRVRSMAPVFAPAFPGPGGRSLHPNPPGIGPGGPAPMGMDGGGMQPQVIGFEDVREETEALDFRCRLEAIPLSDSFFPDHWSNWEKQPYLRYIYPTLDVLYDSEADGVYFGIGPDLVVDPARESLDDRDADQERKGVAFSEYTGEVRLLECYILWDGEWRIVTLACDADWRVVRDQPLGEVYPHGRKPVHRLSIHRESNESMGVGIPRLVRHFSRGVDDLYNLMIDAGIVDVVLLGFLEEGISGIREDQLELTPGKWNTLPKGTVPHYAPKNGVQSAHLITFIQLLMGFFERVTSLMDSVLPGNTGGGRGGGRGTETYSGMAMINAEGTIAHAYKGETVRDLVEDLFRDVLQLYAWFIPHDAKLRIFRSNEWVFLPVDLQALSGQYDLRIELSDSSSNRMIARREAVERYQMFAQNPVINPVQVAEDMLRAYDVKDTSNYIDPGAAAVVAALKEHPEIPQVMRQYLAQKEQQRQMAEIRDQAVRNIQRREEQDRAEDETGYEDRKLWDQLEESVKKEMMRPHVERSMGLDPNRKKRSE